MKKKPVSYNDIESLTSEVKDFIKNKGFDIHDEFEFLTRLEKILYEGIDRHDNDELEIHLSNKPTKINKLNIVCEEMNCTSCGAITGHTLQPKIQGKGFLQELEGLAWTCTICGNLKS